VVVLRAPPLLTEAVPPMSAEIEKDFCLDLSQLPNTITLMSESKKRFRGSKRRATNLKSPLPWSQEQLLLMDNIVNHKSPPEALQSLKSTNSFTVLADRSDIKLDSILQEIDTGKKSRAWNFNTRFNIINGLLGQEGGIVSRKEVKAKLGRGQAKPHRPEWTDLIYHPKITAGITRPTLRRINGRQVRPLFVYGNDARIPFQPSGYPWQCIGRVFVWQNPSDPGPAWSGAGTLVTHNTILTAGHVAPWQSGQGPFKAQFVPAYFNGSSTLGPNVYSYVQAYWGYSNSFVSQAPSAYDYCVMKLFDPLGDSLGWFGSKTYDSGWNDGFYWTLVGYPGAVAGGEQPSQQSGISFYDDDEDGDAMELETGNGDVTPGDSGGPFFAWWDGWPYIVGVCSGEEEEWYWTSDEHNNIAAAGSPMVDLVNFAWSNW
jgi:V8-like Glu-specific endopeptidase